MTILDFLASTTLEGWATAGVVILGAVLTVGVFVLLFMAQHSPTSPFDAAQMLQDDKGKTSGPRLGYLIFVGIAAWILLWLTVKNRLTPEYFAIALGVFVLGKLGSQYLDKGTPPPPSTQETTLTTKTVVNTPDDAPILTDVAPAPSPIKR